MFYLSFEKRADSISKKIMDAQKYRTSIVKGIGSELKGQVTGIGGAFNLLQVYDDAKRFRMSLNRPVGAPRIKGDFYG